MAMFTNRPSRAFATVACALLSTVAGVVAFTAVLGFTESPAPAVAIGLLVGGAVFGVGRRLAPVYIMRADVPRAQRRAFTIGAVLLMIQLVAATVFIVDPSIAKWDGRPWTPQRSNHSCVSAYWVACEAVDHTPDIYNEALYSLPQVDKNAPRQGRPLGPLVIDAYEYPPAFLALPRLIARGVRDFWGFRRVWFGLMLAVTVTGLIVVARRFDAATASGALWLAPFVLIPPAMIITFLMGNVQLAIIAASLIAMVLFERGRYAAGSTLLAYATVSKLYPALLIFYLLLRRDWRAVAWTAGAALVIVVVTIIDFGIEPYRVFIAELPELLGGEAFAAFRNPSAIAVNESIPGLPFKLALFGVPHMGFLASKVLAWTYTAIVVVLTARFALRPAVPGREPIAWLAILILATLRSPFLPTYAPFPSLWLATLIAAFTWRHGRPAAGAVICWAVLAFTFGTGGAAPQLNAVWTLMHTIAAFVLVAMAIRLAREPAAVRAAAPSPDAVDPVPV
jgi:alpha-1,2-mannosyltransferase